MSSSGVVDVVSPSPRDFQLTSKVPCWEVSRVVLPEPLNSSPFHWVLALLTTAMVLSRYVVARPPRREDGADGQRQVCVAGHYLITVGAAHARGCQQRRAHSSGAPRAAEARTR